MEFTVVDVCCGFGGFATGAIQALRARGAKRVHVIGIDMDDGVLTSFRRAMKHIFAQYELDEYTVETFAAEMGKGAFDFPTESEATGTILYHASPPCQVFSRARISTATAAEHEKSANVFRSVMQVVVDKGYKHFSIENVYSVDTCAIADAFQRKHPLVFEVSSRCRYDAAHFGCPSTRVRLFVTSPPAANAMRESVPRTTVTVREAMRAHDLPLPSEHVSNGNRSTNGGLVSKQIDGVAHTLTASHCLSWCTEEGVLVRGLRKAESACLMAFPKGFLLPERAGAALKAIGNSIPPPMAAAVTRAMLHVLDVGDAPDAPDAAVSAVESAAGPVAGPAAPAPNERFTLEMAVSVLREEVHSLKRKLSELEGRIGSGSPSASPSPDSV